MLVCHKISKINIINNNILNFIDYYSPAHDLIFKFNLIPDCSHVRTLLLRAQKHQTEPQINLILPLRRQITPREMAAKTPSLSIQRPILEPQPLQQRTSRMAQIIHQVPSLITQSITRIGE